jgi:DNA-binding response OmpR family regulator
MNGTEILVVDDDADIRVLLERLFGRAGHKVCSAANGLDALRALYEHQPDLVVLDVSMPGMDGWETLTRIRELTDIPVVMLTARGAELEKVRGLRAGADDYVTKPFGRQELLARAEALLRRARASASAPVGYADDVLVVDFPQRAVAVYGAAVSLTPLEYRLLCAFIRHPGQVLSHEQLLELCWGSSDAASRDQVKLYVGYLRRKLGPSAAGLIDTVRGFGYRFQPASPTTRARSA